MTTPTATKAAATGKILVVDDSPSVRRLLKARLATECSEVLEAENGQQGLDVAAEQSPDIVLLDLSMPGGLDGFQVLRQLKDDQKTGNIPVLVLSGVQTPQDKVTAFDLGAIDFVAKPFDLTELRARVRSAMRLSELLQMLAQRAQIDGLTGLYNRAHFDRRWTEEFSGALRHNRPISLAVIDLDHFKSINDTFGHPAGDAVIKGLGGLLVDLSRSSDIACRYGGEEFVVILNETGPDDAGTQCERVREALEAMTWPRHPERTVTCSIGIAGISAGTTLDAAGVIEEADKQLYKAKKGGRNQVQSVDLSSAAFAKAS